MLINIFLNDNDNEKVKSGSSNRDFNDKLCKTTQKMVTCDCRTQGTVEDTNENLETLEPFFNNDFWQQCNKDKMLCTATHNNNRNRLLCRTMHTYHEVHVKTKTFITILEFNKNGKFFL
jgi:hypothetical protein